MHRTLNFCAKLVRHHKHTIMPGNTKESACRTRYHNMLKSTVERAEKLTANADLSSVVIYRDALENGWSNYNNAYNEHEGTLVGIDETELNTINQEFRKMHDVYLNTKVHLGKLIASNQTGGALNSTMFDATAHEATKTIKMPPIKITRFTGELKDWPEFKATCRSVLIDKIPDVQRLQHLKDALSGEPRDLVSHIFPADGAYERAMKLLVDRYENTRAIVNGHLQRLYMIQRNDTSNDSTDKLREIINTINGLIAAMLGIGVDTSTWDVILIYNTSQCLHPNSFQAWEERLGGQRTLPSLEVYLSFLETRITILENTSSFPEVTMPSESAIKPSNVTKYDCKSNKESVKAFYTLKAEYKCLICKRNHLSSRCDELNRMSVNKRRAAIEQSGVCMNCLQSHIVDNCPFTPSCKKCNGNHHTLLHAEKKIFLNQASENSNDEDVAKMADDKLSMISAQHFFHIMNNSCTILATALVPVVWNGKTVILRALIDQGSTANLITDRACQALQLPRRKANIPLTGVGHSPVGMVLGKTIWSFGSIRNPTYRYEVQSMVVTSITNTREIDSKNVNKWQHIKRVPLADPQFYESNKIDLLLGASTYAEIVLSGIKKGRTDEPIAQQTKLGWIVFGTACTSNTFRIVSNATCNLPPDDPDNDPFKLSQRFEQFKKAKPKKVVTPDKPTAKDIVATNSTRNEFGNFVTNLPLPVNPNSNCVEEVKSNNEPRYSSPHHPLIDSSITSPTHTVLDASAKISTLLDSILCVGSTIQLELFDQLLQWHRFRYDFSGHKEKMYRQVKLNPDHTSSKCSSAIKSEIKQIEQIEKYKSTTEACNMACALLDMRCTIDGIGKQVKSTNSKLGEVSRTNLRAIETTKIKRCIQPQIIEQPATCDYNARKWKANDNRILANATDINQIVNFFNRTFKASSSKSWLSERNTFMLNRLSHIQRTLWDLQWYHVTSVIKNACESDTHVGVQMITHRSRERFWIIHVLQRSSHGYTSCFRHRMRPPNQQMVRTPLNCTEQAHPFLFVACDCTGHLESRLSEYQNQQNAITSWADTALFMCLITWVIHLKVTTYVSATEFIMVNFIGTFNEMANSTIFKQSIQQLERSPWPNKGFVEQTAQGGENVVARLNTKLDKC